MNDEFGVNRELIRSLKQQLEWLENLSTVQLKNWLRRVVWLELATPLAAPDYRTAFHISEIVKRGTESLAARVHEVVPVLLQEWSVRDSDRCLRDLLVLAANLRCAAAESAIATIATERLHGQAAEIELRSLCLKILSGFGCSERTVGLFLRYLSDIEYSATCFRALYRYRLAYAATDLSLLVSVYEEAGLRSEISGPFGLLFFDYLTKRQRVEVWRDIFSLTDATLLRDMLKTLGSIGLTMEIPLKQVNKSWEEDKTKVFINIVYGELKEDLKDGVQVEGLGHATRFAILGAFDQSRQVQEEIAVAAGARR